MYPHDPSPCIDTFCSPWGSMAGQMYVDSICGVAMLLEALILYIALRRQGGRGRWFTIVPLALAVVAFALAYHMWGLYQQHSAFPQFPPRWVDVFWNDSIASSDQSTSAALTCAATALLFPAAGAVAYLLDHRHRRYHRHRH